ncbi:MAG: alanyl-tRNA editing protein [Eubacteriales bacterium]|nr:alanyl-tRNA editing protein [Eubacteriales bacterium]
MAKELFTEYFYQNPYSREMESTIELCFEYEAGLYAVVAEDSCFYPEGGGQPGDRGEIIVAGKSYPVLDTIRRQGAILHLIPEPLAKTPVKAIFRIDWQRRFDFMQQHSGEHLISGICHSLKGYDNVGFHINEETMVIDFNGELSPSELAEIELRANQAVWENVEIEILFPSVAEAKALDYRSKKEVGERLRLVKVGNYDLCACCGTQLRKTGEIGPIRLRRMQKHRGGVRINAYCGRRALLLDREQSEIIDNLVQLFSEPQENLLVAAEDRLEKLKNLDSELALLRRSGVLEKAKAEAGAAYGIFIVEAFPAQELKDLAKELSGDFRDFALLLQVSEAEGKEQKCNFVAARSPESESTYDLRELLQQLKEKFTVRAGGQAAFVQGQVEAEAKALAAYIKELLA